MRFAVFDRYAVAVFGACGGSGQGGGNGQDGKQPVKYLFLR